MKNTWVLSLAALTLAFSVQAKDENAQAKQNSREEPRLLLGAVDNRHPENGILDNPREFYHSQPHRELCWVAAGIKDLAAQAEVVEVFTSPQNTKFDGAQSDDNGTRHLVKSTSPVLTLSDGKRVQKCWGFTGEDPLGDYSIQVRVNSVEYPVQKFTLKK